MDRIVELLKQAYDTIGLIIFIIFCAYIGFKIGLVIGDWIAHDIQWLFA